MSDPAPTSDSRTPIDDNKPLDLSLARNLAALAARTFRPRSPVNSEALFAGRWDQVKTVVDAVSQIGLHIVIFGERGVGKSSLSNVIGIAVDVMERSLPNYRQRLVVKVNANQGDSFGAIWSRAFDEVTWNQNKPSLGFNPSVVARRVSLRDAFGIGSSPSADDVRRVLSALAGAVFIFDEFDRGSSELRSSFTDLIKTLSDYAVDATIIIVGVSDTIDGLVRDHASIVRSIIQVHLPRMKNPELEEIIDKSSAEIGVCFTDEAKSLIIQTSQGLPHYTHLIGLNATRHSLMEKFSRTIDINDVKDSFEVSLKDAARTIQEAYHSGVTSAHKGALYRDVLLACALASSAADSPQGEFYPSDVIEPLSLILKRTNISIATFQGHLAVFCEEQRGPILIKEGTPRSYRYRFAEPLLPPYAYMKAIKEGVLTPQLLKKLKRV